MEKARLTPFPREQATIRICMVSSFATELLEIRSREPSLHVLFIPGNPGIAAFYKDFVEALYENLGGQASITAIGHISHGQKDSEHGRLFSLHEQIDHKVDFIEQELLHSEQSIVLVGHSIGAYIGLEIFKRLQKKVKKNCRALSIFNIEQEFYTAISNWIYRKYHTMCNVLFMAMTEFLKLSEEPDWTFIRAKQDQIAFLFGVDDHWGPLAHLEEISKRAPGVALSVETEGHTHGYCCTEAGSFWVADYVANLIKSQMLIRNRDN